MTEFYTYITKQNDRWDIIADKFYNDSSAYEPIITANKAVPIEPVLQAGIKLKIPVMADNYELAHSSPPWRAAQDD